MVTKEVRRTLKECYFSMFYCSNAVQLLLYKQKFHYNKNQQTSNIHNVYK